MPGHRGERRLSALLSPGDSTSGRRATQTRGRGEWSKMKAKKQAAGRGGARKGAGRKKKVGWKRRPLALRESTWGKLKRLAARRKKKGEANASMTETADSLIAGAVVYFDLEPEKHAELEAFAKERGVTIDQLVSEAVAA